VLAAVDQHPHLLKGFFVNQRLVGVFNYNPVFPILFQTFLGLVADFHRSSLNHIAQVGFVLQHFRNAFAGPKSGIRTFASHIPATVSCRRRNAFFVESRRNLSAAHTIQCHGEDSAHHRSHFLIDDNFVFLRRMHLIAIHGLAANELPFPLFIPLDGFDLLGNVFGIHIVHNGTERGNVIGGGFYTGVNTVQQRNVAHSLFGEVSLHIMTGHDIVTAQTG